MQDPIEIAEKEVADANAALLAAAAAAAITGDTSESALAPLHTAYKRKTAADSKLATAIQIRDAAASPPVCRADGGGAAASIDLDAPNPACPILKKAEKDERADVSNGCTRERSCSTCYVEMYIKVYLSECEPLTFDKEAILDARPPPKKEY